MLVPIVCVLAIKSCYRFLSRRERERSRISPLYGRRTGKEELLLGSSAGFVGKEMTRKKRERKEYIYKKKLPLCSLFCSSNWLAAERPQHYTIQCECKDLRIIIDDGIKNGGEKDSYRSVGG